MLMFKDHLKVRQVDRSEIRADRVGSQLAEEATGDEDEDGSGEESGTESDSRNGEFNHHCS